MSAVVPGTSDSTLGVILIQLGGARQRSVGVCVSECFSSYSWSAVRKCSYTTPNKSLLDILFGNGDIVCHILILDYPNWPGESKSIEVECHTKRVAYELLLELVHFGAIHFPGDSKSIKDISTFSRNLSFSSLFSILRLMFFLYFIYVNEI